MVKVISPSFVKHVGGTEVNAPNPTGSTLTIVADFVSTQLFASVTETE